MYDSKLVDVRLAGIVSCSYSNWMRQDVVVMFQLGQ